jgi:predicted Zn-dependent protease
MCAASLKRTAVGAIAAVAVVACATTPTGRRQLQFFPDEQVAQMGVAAYAQMRKQEKVVAESEPVSRYVGCVANAVTAVVPSPKGGGKWEVTVFAGDQVNAFALPGGKIGIYTGLLKAAQTPAQLAAVVGHEIAHVQAEHANARLSTQFATEAGVALVAAVNQGRGGDGRAAMALLGLGAQVGILLPFSRSQESEADVLGLRYVAEAGFDPQASVELWQNMGKVGGGGAPTFLSTHPSGEQRIKDLRAAMPQALETYNKARAAGRAPSCTPAPA